MVLASLMAFCLGLMIAGIVCLAVWWTDQAAVMQAAAIRRRKQTRRLMLKGKKSLLK